MVRRTGWVALGCLLALVAMTPAAFGAWSVNDVNTSTFTTGDVSEKVNGTCLADGASGSTTSCGTTNPLPATGASTTPTVLNNGTVATTYGLTATSCGAATLTDTAAGTTVAHGGFTSPSYRVSGPKSGLGLAFDGSSTWLSTSGGGIVGPQTYTQLAWFKTTTANGAPILSLGNAINPAAQNNSDRFLWVDKTGHVVGGVYSSGYYEAVGTSVVNDGAWHLAAFTFSGTTMKLYVDGALQTTTTTAGAAFSFTAAWWAVGSGRLFSWPDNPAQNASGVSFFNGSLAGVAVLPTALTAANITALYGSATLSAYATTVATYSPTHYWGLQDIAPTPATASTLPLPAQVTTYPDVSGSADTATISGTVTSATTGPLSAGGSAVFDGSSGYLATANAVTAPTAFTELAWFKDSAPGAAQPLIWLGDNRIPTSAVAQDRILFLDATGHVASFVNNGGGQFLASPSVYTDGAWHLAAFTLSATAGTAVYVDGALKASNSAVTSAYSYPGSVWWSLGTGGAALVPYSGSMAGAAVIPSALTAGQISALYSSANFAAYTSGVLARSPSEFWPLLSPSQAHPDLSGNGNDLTSVNGVSSAASGPLSAGGSTIFDGSTGYVVTTGSATPSATYTELAWFKSTASVGGMIMGFQDTATPSSGTFISHDRMIWLDDTGHLRGGSDSLSEVGSSGTYNDGAWHFVAATLSGAGLKVYVDGTLLGTNATVTSGSIFTGWWILGSGQFSTWPNAPTLDSNGVAEFNGSLAGVSVLPTALSGAQVSSLYGSATFAAYTGTVLALSPTAYWSLVSVGNACTSARATASITISGVTTCILPALASGTACPAVATGGLPLTALTTLSVPSTVSNPVGTTATLTINLADDGTLPSALTGTDVLLDPALTATFNGWSTAATYPSGQTTL